MQTVASGFAHITTGHPTGSSVSPGAVGFWREGSFPRADAQHLAAAADTSPALPNTSMAPFTFVPHRRSVKSLTSTAQKALGFNRCRMHAHHIGNKLHVLQSEALQTQHTFINFRKSTFLRLLPRKFLESQQRT